MIHFFTLPALHIRTWEKCKLDAWILITGGCLSKHRADNLQCSQHPNCNYEFFFGMKNLCNLLSLTFKVDIKKIFIIETVAGELTDAVRMSMKLERIVYDYGVVSSGRKVNECYKMHLNVKPWIFFLSCRFFQTVETKKKYERKILMIICLNCIALP